MYINILVHRGEEAMVIVGRYINLRRKGKIIILNQR